MKADLSAILQLLQRASTVHVGSAELVVFDADTHVSDETVGASRVRTVLVIDPDRVIPADGGPGRGPLEALCRAWRTAARRRSRKAEAETLVTCAADLAALLEPPLEAPRGPHKRRTMKAR